jgi:prevent-host-death family protein
MSRAGLREFKNNVSRFVRRAEAGERIIVTSHGSAVAELVPPTTRSQSGVSRLEALTVAGIVTPALATGNPFGDWPDIRLPPGTAAALINEDRDDT